MIIKYINLPETDFFEALAIQRSIVKAKIEKKFTSDIMLLLEHTPVFTLGKNGGIENLNVSTSFLKNRHIELIKTERGGNITFHAPGQLVIYPIINIKALKIGVAEYVSLLEELMIKIIEDYDIKTKKNEKNRGVWVGNKKIGSVGIAVKRGIAFHGIAINIDISLEPFQWINPCGLKIDITSIKNEIKKSISMDEIKKNAVYHFKNIFNYDIRKINFSDLKNLI